MIPRAISDFTPVADEYAGFSISGLFLMFGIPETRIIAFGIAIGYHDTEAGINNFLRERKPLETFTVWHGF